MGISRTLADRVQLQGEWWNNEVHGFRLVSIPGDPGGRIVIFGPAYTRKYTQKSRPKMFHVKHFGTIEQKGAVVPEKIVPNRQLEHDPILFKRIMLPPRRDAAPRRNSRALSAMAITSGAP
jgi:hypothetical protein